MSAGLKAGNVKLKRAYAVVLRPLLLGRPTTVRKSTRGTRSRSFRKMSSMKNSLRDYVMGIGYG